jgi:hypothetical protein
MGLHPPGKVESVMGSPFDIRLTMEIILDADDADYMDFKITKLLFYL